MLISRIVRYFDARAFDDVTMGTALIPCRLDAYKHGADLIEILYQALVVLVRDFVNIERHNAEHYVYFKASYT